MRMRLPVLHLHGWDVAAIAAVALLLLAYRLTDVSTGVLIQYVYYGIEFVAIIGGPVFLLCSLTKLAAVTYARERDKLEQQRLRKG